MQLSNSTMMMAVSGISFKLYFFLIFKIFVFFFRARLCMDKRQSILHGDGILEASSSRLRDMFTCMYSILACRYF